MASLYDSLKKTFNKPNVSRFVNRASDLYNPFDKDYRKSVGDFYNKQVVPTTRKVPGLIQDFKPDRKLQLGVKDVYSPITAPTNILKQGLNTSKSGRDLKRGFNEFFASTPQWAGGFLKSQYEQDPTRLPMLPGVPKSIASVRNPLINDQQEQRLKGIQGNIVGGINTVQQKNAKWIAGSDLAVQESQNDLSKQIGGGGASLATAAGITALTKNPQLGSTIAGGAFGLMSKGRTYEEARAAGLDPAKADVISTVAGVTEAALEKIGLDVFTRKFGTGHGVSNFITNSIIKSASEGMQEGTQELGSNFWAKVGYDKERDLMEGVFESAFIGAGLGLAGGGSASSISQNLYQKGRQSGLSHEQASTFSDVMADKISGKIKQGGQYLKDNPPGLTIKDVSGNKKLTPAEINQGISDGVLDPNQEATIPLQTKQEQKLEVGKATVKPANERKLVTSFKESDKINKDLKSILAGEYSPKQNSELYDNAKNRVRKDFTDSVEFATTNISDEAFATGYAVIEKSMNAGDTKTAGDVAIRMAENATKAGQAVQALAMLDKMTPAGLVAYVERRVNRFNTEQSKKKIRLGKQEDLKMTTKQRSYFMKTAAKVQKMKEGTDKDVARFLLLQEVDDVFPSSGRDKVANFWRAGLLTGTATHLLNMASTGANLTSEQASRIVAVPLDMLASLFTGKRSISGTTKGYGQGAKKGLGEAALYMKTGFDRERISSKLDYRKTTYNTKVGKVAGKGSEYVYRLLGAEDKLFWNSALQNSLFEQATIEAKNKKLKGQSKKDYIQKRVANPSNKLVLKAQEQADVAAFHNKTRLGELAKKLQSFPGGEYIVPFTNTPAAVAMQVAKYTPGTAVFTLASEIVTKIRTGKIDQRRIINSLSRNVVGAVPFLVGAMLLGAGDDDEDRITMAYPITDKKKQSQWELEGKQEYSVRMGDKWYQLQAFGPQGLVMALGAKYAEGREEGLSAPESMANAYVSMAKVIKEQSFLEGVQGAWDAIENVGDYTDVADVGGQASKYITRQAASFIPSIVNQAATVGDPLQREVKTGVETFQSRVPGARNLLAPRKDVLGQDIERKGSVLDTILNPARPSKVRNNDSAVVAELSRLMDVKIDGESQAATPARLTNKLTVGDEKIRLSGKELSDLKGSTGNPINDQLAELISSPAWGALNDEQKKKMIDGVVSDTKKPVLLNYLKGEQKIDETQFLSQASKLDNSQQESLISGSSMLSTQSAPSTASSKNSPEMKVEKFKLKNSEENFRDLGDYVLRKNEEGNVTVQSKIEYNDDVYYAELVKYKDGGDVKNWMATAEKKLTGMRQMLADPNVDQLEKIKLGNRIASLIEDMQKYSGYGGFKKPKSGGSGSSTKLATTKSSGSASIKQPKNIASVALKGGSRARTVKLQTRKGNKNRELYG